MTSDPEIIILSRGVKPDQINHNQHVGPSLYHLMD